MVEESVDQRRIVGEQPDSGEDEAAPDGFLAQLGKEEEQE